MRSCGDCSRPCKKHGEPRRNGRFLDQIVVCTSPKCGWCGVETEIVDDESETFIQLDLFAGLDFGCLPDERDADGADRADGCGG